MTMIFRLRSPMHFVILLAATITVVASLAAALAAQITRIAVLGATGNLGRHTVREFLDQNIPVRCLVRTSSLGKIPEEFKDSPLFEVVAGDLLASTSRSANGIFRDDSVAPSAELLECLEGCQGVVACYGAIRRTKILDLFQNPEETDPTHAKQINYRSMIALVAACKAMNKKNNKTKIMHIVRITGKGEDPKGFFSILLNGLGAYCKAWNYQGEVVLRTMLANPSQDESKDSIGYTIVRPGILKKEEKEIELNLFTKEDLELADDGGNNLKVTTVGYSQIAGLLVDLVLSAGDGRISYTAQNHRVTLAAMNSSNGGGSKTSLREKVAALRNDRREFPKSLVAEHKAAVKAFFAKVAAFVSIVGITLVTLVFRALF